MRLQNQQNQTTTVHTMQVNETKNEAFEGDDLQEREKFTDKNGFLSWVGAKDCAKDKLIGHYAIQLMGIDAKEKQPTQPKINHYAYMKQKVKSKNDKTKNKTFKDCQTKWDEEEDTEEKLTTPLSVPEHYKKYTVEEQKIIWQKPNCQQPITGVSYEGPKDAKKIDLTGPNEDAKPVYIATDLAPIEEQHLVEILQEFRYLFARSYRDLKGVDPTVCQHTIPLQDDAKPSRQRP